MSDLILYGETPGYDLVVAVWSIRFYCYNIACSRTCLGDDGCIGSCIVPLIPHAAADLNSYRSPVDTGDRIGNGEDQRIGDRAGPCVCRNWSRHRRRGTVKIFKITPESIIATDVVCVVRLEIQIPKAIGCGGSGQGAAVPDSFVVSERVGGVLRPDVTIMVHTAWPEAGNIGKGEIRRTVQVSVGCHIRELWPGIDADIPTGQAVPQGVIGVEMTCVPGVWGQSAFIHVGALGVCVARFE